MMRPRERWICRRIGSILGTRTVISYLAIVPSTPLLSTILSAAVRIHPHSMPLSISIRQVYSDGTATFSHVSLHGCTR